MRAFKVTALILALFVSGYAVAQYVGRFYCATGCQLKDTPGGFANGDTYTFIFTVVNQAVSSWVDSQGNANTVTICNGTTCSLFTYIKLSGQFISSGYYYSDWTDSGGEGGGGGGGLGGETGGGGGVPGGGGGGGGGCTIVVDGVRVQCEVG